jgi:prolyl oligopeptidase
MCKYLLTILVVLNLYNSYAQKTYNYPDAPKDSIIDIYFDTPVSDPYQWMENPADLRLAGWLESQEKIKKKHANRNLKTLNLRAQIAAMYYGVRAKEIEGHVEKNKAKSKYQFAYKYQSYNRTPNLLYRLRGKSNYIRLVDIKDFRYDKNDNVEVTNHQVNEKYDLVAIEMSHSGSDWREIFFFNLKNGQQLHNSLKNVRINSKLIWHGRNVYYDRYDKPIKGRELLDKATGQKLYYHKVGTPQSEDKLLYKNSDTTGTNSFRYFKLKDKLFFYHTYKYRDKLYRALSVSKNNPDSLFLKKFLIYPNDDAIDLGIHEVFGDSVVLKTNWNAPNGRVLFSNINELNKPVEIIPEYDVILKSVNRLGKDKIACIYRNENKYLALIFDLKGNLLKKIDFPEGKKVNYLSENDEKVEYTDFSVSSFYHPNLWYQLSLKDLTFKPRESLSVPYDPKSLETRYVKYTSKDGTQIPMYITCLKDTKLDGKNPTLIYGYGGYGITIEPGFDETRALWLLHGGILAIPNIRGGGAGGSNWGLEGRRLKKQNAIDDFIAAAEYLINEKYTNSEQLGINGGSHGGLLVGAAITQRPKLFKAAIAEAGPFDMLRFGNYTIGSASLNINEFGVPTDSTDFLNLKSYSPLHNIKKGVDYPNVLLITGDKDDRVPPFHSYKFLATMQEKGSPKSLYLLYLISGAGHGGALTVDDWIDKMLYKYAFLYSQLF